MQNISNNFNPRKIMYTVIILLSVISLGTQTVFAEDVQTKKSTQTLTPTPECAVSPKITAKHAINTKGAGAQDNTKPSSETEVTPHNTSSKHAINTKGAGPEKTVVTPITPCPTVAPTLQEHAIYPECKNAKNKPECNRIAASDRKDEGRE